MHSETPEPILSCLRDGGGGCMGLQHRGHLSAWPAPPSSRTGLGPQRVKAPRRLLWLWATLAEWVRQCPVVRLPPQTDTAHFQSGAPNTLTPHAPLGTPGNSPLHCVSVLFKSLSLQDPPCPGHSQAAGDCRAPSNAAT